VGVVLASGLAKTYRIGEVETPAVRNASFVIEPASFVAFVGPSGSGKSTLINLLGCLDRPTACRLIVSDTDIATLDRRAAAEFRGKHRIIFQHRSWS
jgi:putative ABC transport system ATP-binding protein